MPSITVFGDADPRALEQIERCAAAEEGALGVLCADNHVGYSQPIGGAVAYENHISVSGVGFDIGCLAAGSRVTTMDGATLPIEVVRASDRTSCWDGERVRAVDPHFGAVCQGVRRVVRLALENGRALLLTPDHEVATADGWCAAGALSARDRVACVAHIGMRHEHTATTVDVPVPSHAGELELNLAIKQAGVDAHATAFIAWLLESVGFPCSVPARSGPPRGDRQTWVIQVLGGQAAQRCLFEDVGFCHALHKRLAAATVASVAWQHAAEIARRDAVRHEAQLLRADGAHWHAIEGIAERHGVSRHVAYHAWYGRRGRSRRARDSAFAPQTTGEVAWVRVASVEPAGEREVYDLVTDDPARSFIAEGIVVHNCGNKAVRTPLQASEVDVPRVMDEISKRVSFGVGRVNDEPVDHPVLDKIAKADFRPQRKLVQAARSQLGTVGGGNHYVDLFEDEADGRLWVGVHFGSRGFGHRTASGFLALAAGKGFEERGSEGGMDAPPTLLDVHTELGQAYIAAMNLALDYAYAGRDIVVDKALEILGTRAEHEVHNNHNYAAREEHFGRRFWVVRKGCTPAFPGQEGFVGGSMGGLSVILAGRDSERSAAGLYSTIHGAGRVMSRTQAAGKVRRRKRFRCDVCGELSETRGCPRHPGAPTRKMWIAEQVKPGEIDWPSVRRDLAERGIELRGGAADEAPGVYKQLERVLAAHGDTIEVRHRLRPIGVAMAGADVVDPYKD